MSVITFDFDNTIAMSHMDLSSEEVNYVFDGYNKQIIELIRSHIKKGDDVHIVTSRNKEKEGMFPDDTIEIHLNKLALRRYFWPKRVHYTNGGAKRQKLEELGSTLHYDDDMEEHIDNFGRIPVKNPYDFYKDTKFVGKAVIYDSNNKILLLRRADEGKKWDIPGGHLKDIEVKRGESGLEDGLEREVAEETGLILPFADKIGSQDFTWKGKTNKINIYLSKLEESEPNINLEMQDYMENSEFRWVSMDEMFKFAKNGTQILQKAIELAEKHETLTEKQVWWKRRRKKDRKNRRKLIGMGGNKHFGGGKGHKRPKMGSPKSAPPSVGVLEEENEDEKRMIKVKIIQKTHKAAIIKGNPAHLVRNKAISDKFYKEIGQILKNEGFLVDFHDSKAHWWPGKPKKMVYDLWIGHSLGADRLEGAVEDGYTRKVIGFGVPNPKKQSFLAVNHPKDNPKPGKVSGNEHYMLSDDMKMAIKDTISAIKGAKLDEKRKKGRKKSPKRGKKGSKKAPNRPKKHYHWNVGDWFYGGGYGDGGDGGGGE